MKLLQVLLLLLLAAVGTKGAPRGHQGALLYPFGPEVGDETVPAEDDGISPEVPLWEPFPFYGRLYTALYVSANGALWLGAAVPEPSPGRALPPAGVAFVAPFWADSDVRLGGAVRYRRSRSPQLLARLAQDLAPALAPGQRPPSLRWAFVATWHRVAYFGAASDRANTFQAALGTDGSSSFALLNYGSLQWTTGIADGGDPRSGLGGRPAEAALCSGHLLPCLSLPGSGTPQVLQLAQGTNVGTPGRWVFRLDHLGATQPPPGPAPSPAPPRPGTHQPQPGTDQPQPGTGTTEEVYICQ